MSDQRVTIRYADLPSGNFFRIAEKPERRFFKCQPWVSTTEDLEKMIQFKPDVLVIADLPLFTGGECRGGDV